MYLDYKEEEPYRYCYLYQRVNVIDTFFQEYSDDLKKYTGFSFQDWFHFNKRLCKYIERKIKVEVIEGRPLLKEWTVSRKTLKKSMGQQYKAILNYVFDIFHFKSIHPINLSDRIFMLLDDKLRENSMKYYNNRDKILENAVLSIMNKYCRDNLTIHSNVMDSTFEYDLIIELKDHLVIIEIKYTKRSKVGKLYDQLCKRRKLLIKSPKNTFSFKDGNSTHSIDYTDKTVIFLGIIMDDPNSAMEKFKEKEENYKTNFLLKMVTYYNFEGILRIIYDTEVNKDKEFKIFLDYILHSKKIEHLSTSWGDDLTDFKYLYFYFRSEDFKSKSKIFTNFNNDFIDRKYDRVKID